MESVAGGEDQRGGWTIARGIDYKVVIGKERLHVIHREEKVHASLHLGADKELGVQIVLDCSGLEATYVSHTHQMANAVPRSNGARVHERQRADSRSSQ